MNALGGKVLNYNVGLVGVSHMTYKSKYIVNHYINYLLEPHSSEPLKPFAKGLYFILSCVTCKSKRRET